MSGHLFVVHGDLLGVACDAILIPSGTHTDQTGRLRPGYVTDAWRSELGDLASDGFLIDPPDTRRRLVRIREDHGVRQPAVWAAFTGDRRDESLDFYTGAVEAFIQEAGRAASEPLEAQRPLMSTRRLVALPLVGGGEGGRHDDRGALIRALITTIIEAAAYEDVDVVLVLNDPQAYAASQQARSRVDHELAWADLSDELEREALTISRRALDDELVVFVGAGTSIGAGLPSWSDLLANLAVRARLNERDRDEFAHLEPEDAARILDQRLEHQGGLAAAVLDQVTAKRCSLLHQLIASLPIKEAVTTNYDTLLETACKAVDGQLPRVLPWDHTVDERRWLLKLHGSIDHPDSIVLSRDDYLRFESEGVALAGIVQALLLTRHMLFVGYSLSDDNFYRLAHQVRAALGPVGQESDKPFGTALTPRPPSLAHDLWTGSVRFVSTADEGGDDNPRRLAILLDRIGALAAAPAAHVLVHSYSALLTEPQRRLNACLREVWTLAESGALDLPTKNAVVDALSRIGRPEMT